MYGVRQRAPRQGRRTPPGQLVSLALGVWAVLFAGAAVLFFHSFAGDESLTHLVMAQSLHPAGAARSALGWGLGYALAALALGFGAWLVWPAGRRSSGSIRVRREADPAGH